jgi:hypothetical protein
MRSKKGRSLAEIVSPLDDTEQAGAQDIPADKPNAGVLPARPSIVPINILVTPRDRKRLRQLSLDTGLSLQKLGHEAWNRLLEARGLPPLEPVSASVPSGRSRSQRSV